MAGLRALDPLTVEIRVKEPDGIFLIHLALATAGIYKEISGNGPFHYCGAGPWKNVRSGPDYVEVAPFAEHHGGAPPKLDGIVYCTGATSLARAWPKGDLDFARVGPGEAGLVLPSELHTYAGLEVSYAAFTPDVPLPVRQLANRVLDREKFCATVLDGLAEASHGVIPPGIRGAHPTPRRFDEGVMPVLSATYTLNAKLDAPLFAELARALAPHRVVLVSDASQPWQLRESGWIPYPDPDGCLRLLFHSKSGQNLARYSVPEVDALLEKGRAMSADLEDEDRLALYQKVEDRIVADAPWLFLWHEKNRVAIKSRLQGVRLCGMDEGGMLLLSQTGLALGR